VEAVAPAPDAQNICRNAAISATFSGLLDQQTVAGNIMLLGDYGASQCPPNTSLLAQNQPSPNSNWLARAWRVLKNLLSRWLGQETQAAEPANFTVALQAGEAEAIRGADLNHGRIQTDLIVSEKPRDVGNVGGNVINFTLKCRLPHGIGERKKFQRKAVEKTCILQITIKGKGEHLINHDVLKGHVIHHGPDQMLGFAASGPDENPAAPFYF